MQRGPKKVTILQHDTDVSHESSPTGLVKENKGGKEQQTASSEYQIKSLRYQAVIDTIHQGVCFYGKDQRLLLCNERYGEIYRVSAEQIRLGVTLREVAEARWRVGTCTTTPDEYVAWCDLVNSGSAPQSWLADLPDGRIIKIQHRSLPDGSWISVHEDITELQAIRNIKSERISLQMLIDLVPSYLWIKDIDSRFVVANKALASDSGRARTADMIGLTDFDLHPSEKAKMFRAVEAGIIASENPIIGNEEYIVTSTGQKKWFSSTKVPLMNEAREVYGLVGIAHDITVRKQADALRDGQSEILEMIAMNAPLENVLNKLVHLIESQMVSLVGSILVVQKNGVCLEHSAAPSLPSQYIEKIDGASIGPNAGSCGTAVYRREVVITPDILLDPLWEDFREAACEHGLRSCWSTPIQSHQGEVFGVFALYSRTVRLPTAPETNLIDIATRIASIAIGRRNAEDQIYFMANHDSLTGLPNRALLNDRLAQAIIRALQNDLWTAVVFLDLDYFKLVNDGLGHSAGDELLQAIANRMINCVRPTDTVVRLGGDEFVIVLSDYPKDTERLSRLLEDIHVAIGAPILLAGNSIQTTASVGVAIFPADGDTPEALLANADAAMYQAKKVGRNNLKFYTPDFNIDVRDKLLMQDDLRKAVSRSEFFLEYQPQQDLRSGDILAVEALIRWRHPRFGLIPPANFIPIAEEMGLIVAVGRWVLHEACRQNKAWQDAGLAPIRVCVNVSAKQFRDKCLIVDVKEALRLNNLEARYLEIELTESLIMQDVEQAVALMAEIERLGVQLAIDDFGIGYSSLSALKTFPVTRLKIDKSFVDSISDSESRDIVATIIQLGQKLSLRVIAEGVDNRDQLDFLRDHGCDEVQGFCISKPIGAAKVADFVRRVNKRL